MDEGFQLVASALAQIMTSFIKDVLRGGGSRLSRKGEIWREGMETLQVLYNYCGLSAVGKLTLISCQYSRPGVLDSTVVVSG